MFRLSSNLINAAIFGSLAFVAVSPHLDPAKQPTLSTGASGITGQRTSVVRTVTEVPSNPVRTVTEVPASPVRTVTEVPSSAGAGSPVRTIPVTAVPIPVPAQRPQAARQDVQPAPRKDAQASTSGPRLFSPSSPLLAPGPGGVTSTHTTRSADAVVPPLVRKKPAVTADASDGTKKTAAKPKEAIDLSGRSSLGAGTRGPAVKCNAGQKYDTKAAKCVADKDAKKPDGKKKDGKEATKASAKPKEAIGSAQTATVTAQAKR